LPAQFRVIHRFDVLLEHHPFLRHFSVPWFHNIILVYIYRNFYLYTNYNNIAFLFVIIKYKLIKNFYLLSYAIYFYYLLWVKGLAAYEWFFRKRK